MVPVNRSLSHMYAYSFVPYDRWWKRHREKWLYDLPSILRYALIPLLMVSITSFHLEWHSQQVALSYVCMQLCVLWKSMMEASWREMTIRPSIYICQCASIELVMVNITSFHLEWYQSTGRTLICMRTALRAIWKSMMEASWKEMNMRPSILMPIRIDWASDG